MLADPKTEAVAEPKTHPTEAERLLAEAYNKVPYQSFPFSQSHPTHLFTLGTLFGLKPPAVEKARVLELGCAAGGNLLPIAYHFPRSQCLGIDISQTEINEGNRHVSALGLRNITLRQQALLDFSSQKEGKFDYIICHGVYSWIDEASQNKILQICRESLSPTGIAYISYNTLPGWHMVNSIRDLMMWHTKSLSDPATKAQQARLVLKFIADGLQNDQSPYANFIKSEIQLLSKQSDNYLLHDHLSSFNKPLYFHEFIAQANAHELAYLSDAFLCSMFTDNLPPQFATELKKVNHIVATNQYMDFIRNQRFRCTLLCHQEQTINRALKATDVESFYLQFSAASPEKPDLSQADIIPGKDMAFTNGLTTLTLHNTFSQLAMVLLYESRHKPMHFQTLCEKLKEKGSLKDLSAIQHHLIHEFNLMRTVLAGLLHITSYPGNYTDVLSSKPKACPLAIYYAKTFTYATNRRHQTAALDPLAKYLLPFLDGTRDLEALVALGTEAIQSKHLHLLDKDQQPIQDEAQIQEHLKPATENTLQYLLTHAFLIE